MFSDCNPEALLCSAPHIHKALNFKPQTPKPLMSEWIEAFRGLQAEEPPRYTILGVPCAEFHLPAIPGALHFKDGGLRRALGGVEAPEGKAWGWNVELFLPASQILNS